MRKRSMICILLRCGFRMFLTFFRMKYLDLNPKLKSNKKTKLPDWLSKMVGKRPFRSSGAKEIIAAELRRRYRHGGGMGEGNFSWKPSNN